MITTTQQQKTLKLENVHVSINDKKILNGLTLEIKPGEIHAVMGPNGSGKSTLSYAIAGHPKYATTGKIQFGDKDLLSLPAHERAKEGIFLAFQYPLEIPGLGFAPLLFSALKIKHPDITPLEFNQKLKAALAVLGKDTSFIARQLNVGFSGGEKKRAEVLQLLLLEPNLAILDETDSGLDVDALQTIATALNNLRSPTFSALVITHYPKMLELLKPDFVHILKDGKIVLSGNKDLIKKIEEEGYTWLQ